MRRPKYLRIGEVNEVNVTVSGLGMECLTLADATGGAPGFPLSPGTVLFTSLHLRGNLGYPGLMAAADHPRMRRPKYCLLLIRPLQCATRSTISRAGPWSVWLHGKAMRRRAGCRFGDCGYSARSRTSLPDRSLIVAFVGRQYLAEHAEENRAGRRGGVGKNDTTTRRFRYVDLGNPRIVESNLRTTAQRESSFRICPE